jgi:predicted  nucleic acid-binding Zn-ribbon protein
MPVEMPDGCPVCGSNNLAFAADDEAECFDCGERFLLDTPQEDQSRQQPRSDRER